MSKAFKDREFWLFRQSQYRQNTSSILPYWNKKQRTSSFYICLFFTISLFLSFDFVKMVKVDLNGDGKVEEVSISIKDMEFLLKVDKASIKGELNGEVHGFAIVDIDTTDQYKEIAVHTPGDSDDDEYLIYWYDGKAIKEMGKLSRWPEIPGNGIVLVNDWMGFWQKRDKYVLDNKTRTLQLVPQELYYVGIEAAVKESFPIYKTRTGSEIVANLKPDSKIFILVCDPSPADYDSHWYLIKSETGLVGWATLGSFAGKVEGLPWAD